MVSVTEMEVVVTTSFYCYLDLLKGFELLNIKIKDYIINNICYNFWTSYFCCVKNKKAYIHVDYAHIMSFFFARQFENSDFKILTTPRFGTEVVNRLSSLIKGKVIKMLIRPPIVRIKMAQTHVANHCCCFSLQRHNTSRKVSKNNITDYENICLISGY